MHDTNALIQLIKKVIENKVDSQQFTKLLKDFLNCETLFFYGIRYGKPFLYPDDSVHKTAIDLAIKSGLTQVNGLTIIPIADQSYMLADTPLAFTEIECILIETAWKAISYRQYIQFLSLVLDHSPDLIAYKDRNQIYRYANKKANDKWPHLDTLIHKHVSEVYPPYEVDRITDMDNYVYEKKAPHTSIIEILSENGYLTVESTRVPVYDEGQIEGILTINKNITDIKRIEKELKRSYDFQDILIQIASVFINVPVEQSNEAISKGLGMVGKHIQADRVYVFDYDFDKGITNNTHEYCNDDIEPMIDFLQNQPIEMIDAFWMEKHKLHESVYIPDIEAMNHDSELYKVLSMQDIKSLLTIPLYDENHLYGFVGFDAVKDYAKWTDDEQKLLKVLAELIVNLKVKQAQQQLLIQEKQNALKASEAKGEFLANMSHEIRTPLSGISNALYLLKNTELTPEQTDYLDIAKSSIESLSRIVNNILDLSKIEAGKLELEMSSFDLENELYQIIKMQEYMAIEKGLTIEFDYDYSIVDEIITDRTRFRQIILNLISNAIKYTDQGKVTVRIRKVANTTQSMSIQFDVIDSGIGIPRKLLSKVTDPFFQIDSSITKKYPGTGLGLPIVKRLLGLFNSQLMIESELGHGSKFSFTMTFSIGVNNPYKRLTGLKDKRLLIIEAKAEHALLAQKFFQTLSDVVDIQSNAIETAERYDFLMIQRNMDDIDRQHVDYYRSIYGTPDSKVVLCSRESVTRAPKELQEKSLDYVLSMPTTRERVHQLLTNKEKQKSVSNPHQTAFFKHKKVLVVDDNKVNRQAMQIILSKSGLEVILASSGLEAIERVQLTRIDIMLMDIQMPEMDGYETAKKIRALGSKYQKMPIIAVTANATESTNEKALLSGMNRSITKPFKPENLLEMIKTVIDETLQKATEEPLLQNLNIEALFKAYDSDASLIYEILKTFTEDYHEQVKKLEDALELKDYDAIEKSAHYLKGSTNYIFAEKSALSCQEVMRLVRQGSYDMVEAAVKTLIIELKQVYDEMIEHDYYRN